MREKIYNVLKLILCFFSFFYIGTLLKIILELFNIDILSSNKGVVISQFILSFILFILLLFVYFKDIKKDFKHFFANPNKSISYVIKMFIVFMVVKYVVGLISVLVCMLLKLDTNSITSVNQELIKEYVKTYPLLMIISTSVLAPFYEESLFRMGIRKVIKNRFIYIIVSGSLFGLLHVFPLDEGISVLVGVVQSISYVTMGLFFSYIYSKTDNIFNTIGIHFLNNFLSVLTMLSMF